MLNIFSCIFFVCASHFMTCEMMTFACLLLFFVFFRCAFFRASRSVVSDSATPWTVARQASLSMEFSRQEYYNGLPFPSPGGSSQPRDWIQVSHIAGRFFTVLAAGVSWFVSKSMSHTGDSHSFPMILITNIFPLCHLLFILCLSRI